MAVEGIPGLLRWAPFTSYRSGERFAAPNGDIVTANIDFTSGATYSATNVTASSQDGRIHALEVLGGFTPGNTSDVSVAGLLNSATDTRNALDVRYVNEADAASLVTGMVTGSGTVQTALDSRYVNESDLAGMVTGPGTIQTALDARYVNESDAVSMVTGAGAFQTALDARYVNAGELGLDAKNPTFGAVGDKVADDTAALQAWINAGGTKLTNGNFRITAGLTIPGNDREFVMDNATIFADTPDITVLTATGNNVRIRAKIDGNNKANYGIRLSGSGCLVEQCVISNIYSSTSTARAIEVTTTGGAIIRDNVITNVTAVGDTTQGNANGSARAVMITATAAATLKSVIANNTIDNIVGEEGDGIQVLFTGAGSIYPVANVTVEGNQISNVSRRFIKIQGSNCRVLNNILTHDGAVPVYPGNAIDIIQSENITVADNFIGNNPLQVQINAVGTSGGVVKNIVIRNNVIRQDDTKAFVSVFLNYITESTARENTIHGGTNAISMGNSTNSLVQANAHFGGAAASVSFSANATNIGIVMRLNVNMNNARTSYVSNSGTGALTEYNSMRP